MSSKESDDDENKENKKNKDKKEKDKGVTIKSRTPPSSNSEKSTSSLSSMVARKVEKPHEPQTNAPSSTLNFGSQPSSVKVRSQLSDGGRVKSAIGRHDSNTSVSSVGIGASQATPLSCPSENALPKLIPEGVVPEGQAVYDCIVYLFYCPAHDRFAVTNVERSRVVWFPFVVMRQDITNHQAALEEMPLFLGRRDAEADGDQTFVKMPKFSGNQFFHVLHVRLPSDKSFHRFAHFVQIDPTEGYQCCEQTARLTWIQTSEILQDQVDLLWGPEVKQFVMMLIRNEPVYIKEFTREDALFLLTNPDRASMYQSRMLLNCKISTDTVLALFEDFVEHCFPATFMAFESFKCYLIKYGFSRTDPRFLWLFNAVGYHRKGYLEFSEFLVGIVSLEPSIEHTEGRYRLVFRYYDINHNDKLNMDELLCLLQDIDPKASPEGLREQLEQYRLYGMSYETFHKAVQTGKLRGTESLCRAPKSIISKVMATKAKRRRNSSNEKSTKTLKRKARGVCVGCRTQKLDYCLHTVYFDMAGTCQKPQRIKDVPVAKDDAITPTRYSSDFVFSVESLYRMFIDLIRNTYYQVERVGLMSTPDDAPWCAQFVQYVQTLTENVSELLSSEERLIRINAPAVVIGDILGNFDSLMAMERALWQSIPVMQNNLVFLGNYSGPSRFNVEVICYVLALKVLAPNKVFLLRGSNETREDNKATLLLECEQKYGPKVGRIIWNSLNEALDRLPMAVLIDESIFCVHSGVPKSPCVLDKLFAIHEVIQKLEKESPLAFELIFNTPSGEDQSQSESIGSTSSQQPLSTEFSLANFSSFLRENKLTHMIRGNESLVDGYRLQYGSRIVTISSVFDPTVAFVDCTSGLPSIRLVRVPLQRQLAGLAGTPSPSPNS